MAIRFALCNEVFQGWRVDDALAFIREVGYDGVEIAPFTLAESADQVPPKSAVACANWRSGWAWKSSGCIGCSSPRQVCT
jgi:hypothetical protein